MKLLWIVSSIKLLPEASQLYNGKNAEIKETGGWITASARSLVEDDDIELSIATVFSEVREIKKLQGNRITYYLIPAKTEGCWSKVIQLSNPDVIHIHGTENHDVILDFLSEYGSEKVVVSMQGVRNAIKNYAYSGIGFWDRLLNTTIRDVLRHDMMISSVKLMQRAEKESMVLSKVNYIIGRTISDRSYTWSINPQAEYFFCNETLREEFYSGRWSYESCIPHTIFLSQAYRPLKGLHLLLKALPIVLNRFPNTKVRVAGEDFVNKKRIKMTGYGKYIKKEIDRLKLKEVIDFLGPLNAALMKQEYLKSNLFISPSTIENSPNSLCEAQMLGVPCLASFVGGVPNMIPNSQCGEMYRFDETEVLAYQICNIFEKSSLFDNTTMCQMAHQRHDPQENVRQLKNIYGAIYDNHNQYI